METTLQLKRNDYFGKLAKISIVLAVLIGLWLTREPLLDLLRLVGDREATTAFLQGYGTSGPIALSFLLVAQVFFAFIPGHILMISGGYVYGFMTAFLITLTSTVIGSQLAFVLARRAGRPVVNRLISAKLLDRWGQVAERNGAMFFLFAFWVPLFPSDAMCFVAGLSAISFRRFFVVNFLGL